MQTNIKIVMGTVLQTGRSPFRFPMKSFDFFTWPNRCTRTMALWWTQPLIFFGGKGRPARKTDNLSAVCEPIV
jgi:hypothetical protein